MATRKVLVMETWEVTLRGTWARMTTRPYERSEVVRNLRRRDWKNVYVRAGESISRYGERITDEGTFEMRRDVEAFTAEAAIQIASWMLRRHISDMRLCNSPTFELDL